MRVNTSIGFPGGVEPTSTPFGKKEHPSANTKDWRTANPRRKDEV